MEDNNTISQYDFNGGEANNNNSQNELDGGNIKFPLFPSENALDGFTIDYTNIALNEDGLNIVNQTFKEFNKPNSVRFIKESLSVTKKAQTLDSIDLSDFFHPLQAFSNLQKQTFVIGPETSANLDPSTFDSTLYQASLLFARAYYLPNAEEEQKILFWDYKGTRNIMGEILILSGAVKDGVYWKGWDLDPFLDIDHSVEPNPNNGGIIFNNPTSLEVKLIVIIAN